MAMKSEMSEKLAELLLDFDNRIHINNDSKFKQALNTIISAEQRKRIGKVDTDLISECVDLLLLIDNIDVDELNNTGKEIADKSLSQYRKYKETMTFVHIKCVKRIAVVLCTVLALLFAITATAAAMGYSITDLGKKILNINEKTSTDYNGIEIIRTNDTRIYKSMSEMLEIEKLNILYPVKLPAGYEFTDYRIDDFGSYSEVRAYTSEPYLVFTVEIETSQVDTNNYLYETNGIKYNIVEMGDGFYQAWWFNNNDYYTITVSNKNMLSEIIKNLMED